MCVRARARGWERARVFKIRLERLLLRAMCVRACMCVRVCERACVRASVWCVRMVCVCACARACVRRAPAAPLPAAPAAAAAPGPRPPPRPGPRMGGVPGSPDGRERSPCNTRHTLYVICLILRLVCPRAGRGGVVSLPCSHKCGLSVPASAVHLQVSSR